jgi:GNAT superfamily N-acetyltransferase
VTIPFSIEALGVQHDRSDFSCGQLALDQYLKVRASQDVKRRMSNCFVACDKQGQIAAYYTLAATSLPLTELSEFAKKRLPRYELLPAVLIGRLAVNEKFQRQGIGGALIIDAAKRASSAEPAVFALIVEAKDESAKCFYQHLGFQAFASKPKNLFLPLATVAAALGIVL